LPTRIEILDAKQADFGGQQLLLYRQQGREFDIVRVQLDLDDRPLDHLEFDEAEIFDRERDGIVIGIGVPQCR